jgi:predicted hydrocarbon binding protein
MRKTPMIGESGNGNEGIRSRDLALPAAALTHLRRALRAEAGPLQATHALHDAGFATGEALYDDFARMAGEDPLEMDEARFWQSLSRFFDGRGWGRIEHGRLHPGLGIVRARGWAECDPEADEAQPSCAFTSGVLARILGRVAEGPVAVLEVACGSTGGAECHFLFGSEGAIHEVYGHLLEGESLDSVLQTL